MIVKIIIVAVALWYLWAITREPKFCYKERLGYTCHHRKYKDGTLECGSGPDKGLIDEV